MNETFKKYFKENKVFLIGFILIWLAFLAVEIIYSRIDGHYFLNGCHTPFLDTFFKYFTYIGGGFPVYLGLIILLFNIRKGLFILLGQGVASLITQPLKYALAHPRPATLFNELGISLPDTVDGVLIRNAYNSFPSGHTSAAFALCACLAALVPKKYWPVQIILIAAGWLGAYSRIYLSQHFLDDILLGSVIGVFSAAIVYAALYRNEWGERSLFRRLK